MIQRLKKLVMAGIMMLGVTIMLPQTAEAQQMMLPPMHAEENYQTYDDIYAIGDFEYVLYETNVATITKYTGNDTDIVIPAYIGGYPVKKVARGTIYGKRDVNSITISEGIEVLYSGWIQYSTVKSIHFSSTVKADSSNVGTKDGIPSIWFSIVEKITVDKNNKCLTVVDGILYTKDMKAVLNRTKASGTKVVLPESVVIIAGHAFYCANDISELTIPDTVEYIGERAFLQCNDIGLTIPKSTKYIGSHAFDLAYMDKVHIPAGVTEIGEGAFFGTMASEFTVDAQNKKYSIKNNALYIEEEKCLLAYPSKNLTAEYTVPEGTKRIGAGACAYSNNFKNVIIPDTVTEIGLGAFWNCVFLQSVQFSSNLKKMEWDAFDYCYDLREVYFRGDAPEFPNLIFVQANVTLYYPANNASWKEVPGKLSDTSNLTFKEYNIKCEAPAKPYKIANVVSGVHVYWKEVAGAAKYGLWRSETGKNGTYKWVANPTVTHFTDTKVESGKTYYYKVTALSYSNDHSEKSEPIGITYVSTPDISTRENKAAGIQLGWKKVAGATGYGIYRKSYEGNDAWVRVGTVEGNSTFTWTDTSVKNNNGTIYKYTIRALAGSDRKTLSGCRNAGRTMVRLSSQVLNSAAKTNATSIKCSWTTSSKVTGYEVRFVADGKVYKTFTVGNYKTGTKTFTGLKSGKTYKVQVRSYKKVDGVGSFYSAWSTAKNVGL